MRKKVESEQSVEKKKKLSPEEKAKAKGDVYYLHSSPKENVRATIAGFVDKERKELHYGVAICASGDNFTKKLGRVKAMGRAVSTKRRIVRVSQIDHRSIRLKLQEELTKRLKV